MKQPTRKLDEKTTALVTIQLCKALGYLHERKIIHRDIKPENILLDGQDSVKLADFGWSNFEEKFKKRETYCGTIDYLAPEMADHSHRHDHRVDIWSVGVLIYELLTGNAPFAPTKPGASNSEIELETKRNILKQKFEFPKDFPQLAKDLVKKILVLKPEDRLPIDKILSHPWLSRYIEESPDKTRIQRTFTNDSQNNLNFSQFLKQNVQLEDVNKEGGYIKNEYTFNPDELDKYVKPESVILRSDLHFVLPLSNMIGLNQGSPNVTDRLQNVSSGPKNNFLSGGSASNSSSPVKHLMTGALSPPLGPNPYAFGASGSVSNLLGKPQDNGYRSSSQQKSPILLNQPQPIQKAQSRGNSPPKNITNSYSTTSGLSIQSSKQGIPPPGPQVQSPTYNPYTQTSAQKAQPPQQPKSTGNSNYVSTPKGANTPALLLQPPEKALITSVPAFQPNDQGQGSPRDRGDTTLSNQRPSKGRMSVDEWSMELTRAKERIFELNKEVGPYQVGRQNRQHPPDEPRAREPKRCAERP
jgi:serine/threonine protein kinase